MRLTHNDVGLYVSVDYLKWAQLASTPLWLRITGPGWKPSPLPPDVLRPLAQSAPSRLFTDLDYPTQLAVPLFPLLGVERDRVMADLGDQLVEVLRLLATLPAPEAKVVAPPARPPPEELHQRVTPAPLPSRSRSSADVTIVSLRTEWERAHRRPRT